MEGGKHMLAKPGFVGRVKVMHALEILRKKARFQSCNQSAIIKTADSHCANPPNHTENAWNHGFSDALYQAVRPRVLFWRGQALGQKEFGHMASEKRHGMRWEEG